MPNLFWFLPVPILGLVQASELNDLDARLDAAANALASTCEVDLATFAPVPDFAVPLAVLVDGLEHCLEERRGRYALCTMCIGVGQGIALIIERLGD